MEYWARKLHMKGKKSLKAENAFDAIGGLLEGLDFFENYGEREQNQSEESSGEESPEDEKPTKSRERHLRVDELPSDDELSSGDFDEFDEDDLDEEEWKQLRELEEEGEEDEEGNSSLSSGTSGSDNEGAPSRRRKIPTLHLHQQTRLRMRTPQMFISHQSYGNKDYAKRIRNQQN